MEKSFSKTLAVVLGAAMFGMGGIALADNMSSPAPAEPAPATEPAAEAAPADTMAPADAAAPADATGGTTPEAESTEPAAAPAVAPPTY